MLVNEKGATLAPIEEALLANWDGRVVQVLLNGDRNGYCDLTEAFVCALFSKNLDSKESEAIASRIVSCTDFLTPKVIDAIFATKDATLISQYLYASRGYGMESRHVIELINMGNEDCVNFYFERFAAIVMQDNWFRPVVEWLKESGLYASFRAKYMPKKKFGSK